MAFSLSTRPRTSTWLILLLLVLFVGTGYRRYANDTGDDLASSYIGCRLVATDQGPHLYAFDPHDFAAVGPDDEWETAANDGNYNSWLHTYVQTPLWAWSLQPLCTRVNFSTFDHIFDALTLVSFAILVWLVARIWSPRLLHPGAIAVVLLALWFTTPFKYAMTLMQTHIFFVLLTIGALMLASRRRPLLAGTLLALAAAVKLTPAIFLVYWLLTRRYRAALTFIAVSVLLLVLARVTAGPELFAQYLATLHRVSGTLLVSQNNQSLAAWWMGHHYPPLEVCFLNIHPLPRSVQLLSTTLILLSSLFAGWLDRRHTARSLPPSTAEDTTSSFPLGALFLLIAATVFTPIAWTHYFIVLLPALMVLADLALARRSLAIAIAISTMLALNLRPIASDVINIAVGRHAILRSQFFAGILCLVTLAAAALTSHRYNATRPTLT